VAALYEAYSSDYTLSKVLLGHELSGLASLEPADEILPTAHGETLVGVVDFELLGS
jgi:hypothetical protein